MRAFFLIGWALVCAAVGAAQSTHWLTVDTVKQLPINTQVTIEIFGFPKATLTPESTRHPKPDLTEGSIHTLILEPNYMLHAHAFQAPLTGEDTLGLQPLRVGARTELPWVTYVDGSFRLDYHAMRSLEHLKRFMDVHPTVVVAVRGLGEEGASEPCDRLGRRRARSVWEYLVTEGIDPKRIELQGTCGNGGSPIAVVVESL